MTKRNLIQAIIDSNMSNLDKQQLIQELLRLDYMRDPKGTEQIIRNYVQSNPNPPKPQ